MWGIPSLALDICSLCEILDDKPSKGPWTKGRPKAQSQPNNRLELDTDTVVIGNGPAGIALSAMLSGWQPFYNKQHPHPDPELHEQLLEMSAGDESLFSRDLTSLADMHHSLGQLVSPGQTPFAVLYDSLARPARSPANDLDRQHKTPSSSSSSSCLCWRRNPSRAVPHIVLGDQSIGGSWTGYDDDMVTVSVSEWMDLPGYSLAFDFLGDPSLAHARPQALLYKHYLLNYVLVMGLEQHFRPFTKVTQLEKFCHPLTGEQYWEVRGIESTPCDTKLNQRDFLFRCRNVVLACGQQQPKMLGVPGELGTPPNHRIVYNLSSLKQCLGEEEADSLRAARAECPVVVVGDGISAADAILHCLAIEQPVLHVIRRTERELRNIQLSRLSPTVYPEYARVFHLMSGRTREVNYRRVLGTSVHAIGTGGTRDGNYNNVVVLDTPQGTLVREHFLCLAVCIGRRSELPLLKEYQQQHPYEFTTHYQAVTDPSLFAVGAIAGDHFVRYLVGGSLCVAQALCQKFHRIRHPRLNLNIARCFPDLFAATPQQRGSCAMLRTNSSAGPLALLKAAALATTGAGKGNKRGLPMVVARTKSQAQLTTRAVV